MHGLRDKTRKMTSQNLRLLSRGKIPPKPPQYKQLMMSPQSISSTT